MVISVKNIVRARLGVMTELRVQFWVTGQKRLETLL